jgi:hypothetical protein
MDKRPMKRQQRKAHEKIVLAYLDAFEQEDDERIDLILRQAEQDPELGKLIWEVHAEYQAELEEDLYEKDVELVRGLLQQHMPLAWMQASEDGEIPPLTVSDVAAHMQAEVAVKGEVGQEFSIIAPKLHQSTILLPKSVGLQGVRKLFLELGVQASKHLQRLFSEAGFILISRRDQNLAHLAATRRQRTEARRLSMQRSDEEQP